MKLITISFLLLISSFFNICKPVQKYKGFTESDILHELDLGFKGIPSDYFPAGRNVDIKYNFFLDLEHGYCVTAGSRIHVYADSIRWAIVFEKSGYQNRGGDAEIELDYFGNCVNYPVDKYPLRNYITNAGRVDLITGEEYDRIKDTAGFELISAKAAYVNIRGIKVPIEHDVAKYRRLGIKLDSTDNPNHLIGYADIVRYLNETNPGLISAKENEIRTNIPHDLPKLMAIDKFHFESVYTNKKLPSEQETYRLLAKILLKRDTSLWKPTLKANNHWSNWVSGNL